MRHRWTPEEERQLRELYSRPDIFAKEMAEIMGRTVAQIYNKANAMGLRAPHERAVISGRMSSDSEGAVAHRFKKGRASWNKGQRMLPETYEKVRRTMFKAGNIPVNHKEVGTMRTNRDGYVEVKVAEPATWRLLHRVVWEKHNGQIPAGCNIQFKNGVKSDCRIENLYTSRGRIS